MEYKIAKKLPEKNTVEQLYVFLENGDFLTIAGEELIKISVKVYDKLVRYSDGFCAVAAEGYIELKIRDDAEIDCDSSFLYDPQEYADNRKKYIERRLVSESSITEIWFLDELNWHYTLRGNFSVEADGKSLKVNVLPQPQMGGFSNKDHSVNLGEIKKKRVNHIGLSFENCDSFKIYSGEICEINLKFDERLVGDSSKFVRRVIGGYMILKLIKYYNPRGGNLYGDKSKRKDFERRLCGAKGFSTHDICQLYVDYYHAGYESNSEECLDIDELKSDYEVNELQEREEEEDSSYYYLEGGYAKLLKDRTIILTFGKNAKRTIKELY